MLIFLTLLLFARAQSTTAPVAMTTPSPTLAPTPPSAKYSSCAAVQPPFPMVSSLSPVCDGGAASPCQWSCAVFDCTVASPFQPMQWYNPALAGSCANLSVPDASCLVGEPQGCPSSSWFDPDATLASPRHSITVGFAQAVWASQVIVLQTRTVGFVVLVEVLDLASGLWLAGFNGTEQNRTIGAAPRLAAFPVPNHVRTDRVRLTCALHDSSDQVNAIVLVGSHTAPAPTPATAPPTPYPLPPPPPRVCPPPYRSQNDETKDLTRGDEWCTLENVCLFPCRVVDCSFEGFDGVDGCDELLDDTLASAWIDVDDNRFYYDWVALDFGHEILAYAIAIEQSEPTEIRPVFRIARENGTVLWSNETGEVRDSDYNPTLGLYVFADGPEPLSKVNITVWPFHGFSIGFVRLVGTPIAPVARRRAERRLEGRFLVNQMPMAPHEDEVSEVVVGRFDILAPHAPPPLLHDGKFWLGPGRYLINRQHVASESYWFDLCQLTSGGIAHPCSVWNSEPVTDSGRPLPANMIHVQASMVYAINATTSIGAVAVWTGGWSATYHDSVPFQYRVESGDWTHLPVGVPRAYGCGMALGDTVYYAGGMTIDGAGTLLSSIESWVFVAGTGNRVSPANKTLPISLAVPRASPGCAVLGDNELVVVGGWVRNVTLDKTQASDAFDIVDVSTNRKQSGTLPVAVVAPSVAAVGNTIIVVSGAPNVRYDPNAFLPYNAYDLSKTTGGVLIYDRIANSWRLLNVLSPLAYNAADVEPWPTLRIAVPFNYDFIAVVGGESFEEHDGSIDPSRAGTKGHRHPIDLYHVAEKRWHLNVAQHHAGLSFSVISSLTSNRLIVAGGQYDDGFYQPHLAMTVLDWEYIERFECEQIQDNCIGCFEDETPFEACAICSGGSCVKAKGGVCPINQSVVPNCSALILPSTTAPVATTAESTGDTVTTDLDGSTTAAGNNSSSSTTAAGGTTSGATGGTSFGQRSEVGDKSNVVLIAVVASLGGLLLLALIGGGVWFAVRRRRAAAQAADGDVPLAGVATQKQASIESGISVTEPLDSDDESGGNGEQTGSGELHKAPPIVPSASVADAIDHKYVIVASELKRGKKLGEGAFGEVYQAKWRNTKVAVKEIRMRVAGDKKQIASFEQEMTAMCRLQPHSNVIQLYGVVIGEQLAIVTEFAPFGALDDWLNSQAGKSANTQALMTIASECSAGLAHLHAQKVIHRDVAARNVLLGVGFVAKIADFGLSRSMAGEDSEDEGKTMQTVGPLRWMSPESMRQRVYSQYTDAFSFGVLLFEIFERKQPWEGLSITEAAAEVLGGKRLKLSRKNLAPDVVREVMADCFKTEPKDRPTLANTCERLTSAANDAASDSEPPRDTEYSAPPSVASGRYTETPPPSNQRYDSIPPENNDDDDESSSGRKAPAKSDTHYSLAPPERSESDD